MNKQRVLLVDDSLKFVEIVNNMIKKKNSVKIVGIASSGEEAIERINFEHPDIVLMDLSMPGMGGLMATRMIKKMANPPKIIILTLHDTIEYRDEAKAVGADGFISKSDFVDKIPDIFSGKLDK